MAFTIVLAWLHLIFNIGAHFTIHVSQVFFSYTNTIFNCRIILSIIGVQYILNPSYLKGRVSQWLAQYMEKYLML